MNFQSFTFDKYCMTEEFGEGFNLANLRVCRNLPVKIAKHCIIHMESVSVVANF